MSTNEELHPPPKPRVSPLDYRNTDLVSRLLAATPPYLYNMPLVPNSYFFSEMLRSLVQAKADASNRAAAQIGMHQRRPRKRSWTQSRSEYFQKASPKPDKQDNQISWSPKQMIQEKAAFDNRSLDRPLELTISKVPSSKASETGVDDSKLERSSTETIPNIEAPKSELGNMPMMYTNPSQTISQDANVVLPPPPMWYPSLYPSPYGIDPLHFFIDLRVSGHIYDRKNQKESPNSNPMSAPAMQERDQDIKNGEATNFHSISSMQDGFKQSRHASAFSVPIPSSNKEKPDRKPESKSHKFDVKSMGFDKSYNKTGTNYVMSNVSSIYRNLQQVASEPPKTEEIQVDGSPMDKDDGHEETEEQKQKRVKDLRALIGLELVVDYMNNAKPGRAAENLEESSAETESNASSAVEVVSVEGNNDIVTY